MEHCTRLHFTSSLSYLFLCIFFCLLGFLLVGFSGYLIPNEKSHFAVRLWFVVTNLSG